MIIEQSVIRNKVLNIKNERKVKEIIIGILELDTGKKAFSSFSSIYEKRYKNQVSPAILSKLGVFQFFKEMDTLI